MCFCHNNSTDHLRNITFGHAPWLRCSLAPWLRCSRPEILAPLKPCALAPTPPPPVAPCVPYVHTFLTFLALLTPFCILRSLASFLPPALNPPCLFLPRIRCRMASQMARTVVPQISLCFSLGSLASSFSRVVAFVYLGWSGLRSVWCVCITTC